MELNPIQLLQQGIYVEKSTPPASLRRLASKLHPIKTQFNLIRVGSESDGGYLLPNDLEGIAACFSPGVADNSSFEMDLLRKTGIESHLADFSVETPPLGYTPKTFVKKFLGSINRDNFMSLDSWISQVEPNDNFSDFLLQMDIEGGEYSTLLSCPIETLCRFRIIVVELHSIYAWANSHFFDLIEGMFDRLLQYFYVVHNHPNNNDGTIDLEGFIAPRTCELTLIRKDRAQHLGYRAQFPHPLDSPNVVHLQDWSLPSGWFHERPTEIFTQALLCRPQGGINDILCCIERCWCYAEQFDRRLFIDCRQSGIRDDFWKYFRPRVSESHLDFDLDYCVFDNVDTLPKCIEGRVSTLHTEYSMTQGGFTDIVSDALVTFEMSSAFDTSLLVHEQGWTGGRFTSPGLLSKLLFTPLVQKDIKARLASLPEKYIGLHVRNTDYTTDYQSFIESSKSTLSGRDVVICSDSLAVINYVQRELTESRVVRLSTFENDSHVRLHYRELGDQQYRGNIEALIDLCALALSEVLLFSNVREANRPSGFSMLAYYLNQNKHIVHELLNNC
jgi:hypothetical protein